MMFTQQCRWSLTAHVAFDIVKLNSMKALNKLILIFFFVSCLVEAEQNPACELNCPHFHLSHFHL